MNIRNISYADMPTCFTNVGQSGSDHTGTDGLNWFSVSLCGLSMLRQCFRAYSIFPCVLYIFVGAPYHRGYPPEVPRIAVVLHDAVGTPRYGHSLLS